MPQCRIVGLELQRDLVRLAGDNAALNGMSARVSAMVGDLLRPPPRLSPGMFDHVMANPPFIEQGRGTPAANPAKAAATIEGDADLGDWVRFALAMVRGKGTVTFIHRADRIDALLGQLAGRAGEVVDLPAVAGGGAGGEPHPGAGEQAGRGAGAALPGLVSARGRRPLQRGGGGGAARRRGAVAVAPTSGCVWSDARVPSRRICWQP